MIEYDEEGIKTRYLEEFTRLKQEGAFLTNHEYSLSIGQHKSLISEIKSGRYKVNLQILVLSQVKYKMDSWYVMFAQRRSSQDPGPLDLQGLDRRGLYGEKKGVVGRKKQTSVD